MYDEQVKSGVDPTRSDHEIGEGMVQFIQYLVHLHVPCITINCNHLCPDLLSSRVCSHLLTKSSVDAMEEDEEPSEGDFYDSLGGGDDLAF